MINLKCSHRWEEICDNKCWCDKCGTLRFVVHSMMTGDSTYSYKTNEMYGNYMRGILNYD